MVEVSIIVPCYNQGLYIEECVNSLVNQTFKDWECIIIDDGSTDNSQSYIKRVIEKDKRIKAVFQENRGVSVARNVGISSSTGMYILPLDADDKLSSNYIEACIYKLKENRSLDLVYGQVKKFGTVNSKEIVPTFSYSRLLEGNLIHCSGMYKKEQWEAIGGYDENMKLGLEDWEFWIHLLSKDAKVLKVEECVLHYRIKPNSRNNSFSSNDLNKIKKYVGTKHVEAYYDFIKNLPDFHRSYRVLKEKNQKLQVHNQLVEKIYLKIKRILKIKK